MLLLGCGKINTALDQDASPVTGTGGNIVGTGGAQPGTGGGSVTDAMGTGGAFGTGGKLKLGTGGATPTGGIVVGSGGTLGNGGTAGPGGSLAAGGRTGAGGATSNGGATGKGGATGSHTFPGKFVGNLDTRNSIRTDFAEYWDQFTPENAGKWGAVEASPNAFNWGALDAMYKYAEDNNVIFKEHCFVWGSSPPNWVNVSNAETAVQGWMKAFCERFPNTRLIDVVNEPSHITPGFANGIGGGDKTTWDWIANAFKWARQACPNAILILNDYDNLESDFYVQRTIDIVNAIKKLDAPIDAIGCETHDAEKLPASTLKANIDLLTSSTGLPVYITEYDIDLADDEEQRSQYADHFTMFMSHPNVKGVTVWGYVVGATWRTNTGLLESDGTMRPAMTWLMGFLGR